MSALLDRARRGERITAFDKIATLSRAELEGWRWAMRGREPDPGEVAALAERERELNGGIKK